MFYASKSKKGYETTLKKKIGSWILKFSNYLIQPKTSVSETVKRIQYPLNIKLLIFWVRADEVSVILIYFVSKVVHHKKYSTKKKPVFSALLPSVGFPLLQHAIIWLSFFFYFNALRVFKCLLQQKSLSDLYKFHWWCRFQLLRIILYNYR